MELLQLRYFLVVPSQPVGYLFAAHALRKQQRILPMLRIPNRQNLLPSLYHTAFSVQKMPTVYSNAPFLHLQNLRRNALPQSYQQRADQVPIPDALRRSESHHGSIPLQISYP